MAGLFTNLDVATPPPTIGDPKIEEERKRQLAARLAGTGRQATMLSGGGGITSPILGNAASIQGGL